MKERRILDIGKLMLQIKRMKNPTVKKAYLQWLYNYFVGNYHFINETYILSHNRYKDFIKLIVTELQFCGKNPFKYAH